MDHNIIKICTKCLDIIPVEISLNQNAVLPLLTLVLVRHSSKDNSFFKKNVLSLAYITSTFTPNKTRANLKSSEIHCLISILIFSCRVLYVIVYLNKTFYNFTYIA